MATPYPSRDGYNRRPRTSARVIRTTFNVVAVGALLSAPVAAVSLWLLLTDPVLAGEVTDRDSLVPLMRALVETLGDAIAAVLAYM